MFRIKNKFSLATVSFNQTQLVLNTSHFKHKPYSNLYKVCVKVPVSVEESLLSARVVTPLNDASFTIKVLLSFTVKVRLGLTEATDFHGPSFFLLLWLQQSFKTARYRISQHKTTWRTSKFQTFLIIFGPFGSKQLLDQCVCV